MGAKKPPHCMLVSNSNNSNGYSKQPQPQQQQQQQIAFVHNINAAPLHLFYASTGPNVRSALPTPTQQKQKQQQQQQRCAHRSTLVAFERGTCAVVSSGSDSDSDFSADSNGNS
ncbi:hypothetical protein AWZ03_009221 [Drosophila navojoa]|uniref:Uncharacterized protein n=1 Tax=Drosophila navojoa TaxID=7232 RepID=A0A484B919_DRONA|nr:hypothetical protein AWZ03_009221 [Drosophila navojoa]